MAVKILLRRGTTAEWIEANPIPGMGEPCAEIKVDGTVSLKVGDGTTHWVDLKEISGDMDEILAITGNLADLDTSDKLNLVAAINEVYGANSALAGRVTGIESKIPTQATGSNQLADKDFVNSSIENMAARYVTPTADMTSQWASLSALRAGPYFINGVSGTPTTNDYAIYIESDGSVWRAKYVGGQWAPQYKVNDTPFTANQLAALNSGITAAIVANIYSKSGHAANQNVVTDANGNVTTEAKPVIPSGVNQRVTLGTSSASGNNSITSPTLPVDGTLGIANGGTGATSAAAARTALGAQEALTVQQLNNIANVPNKLNSNLGSSLAGQFLVVGSNGAITTTDTIDGGGGDSDGGSSSREFLNQNLSGDKTGMAAGKNYIIYDGYKFYEDRFTGKIKLSGGYPYRGVHFYKAILDFMQYSFAPFSAHTIFQVYSAFSRTTDFNFDIALSSDTEFVNTVTISDTVGDFDLPSHYALLKDCNDADSGPRIIYLNVTDFGDDSLFDFHPGYVALTNYDEIVDFTVRFRAKA